MVSGHYVQDGKKILVFRDVSKVTDEPTGLDKKVANPIALGEAWGRRSIKETISAGMEWITRAGCNGRWTDLTPQRGSADTWVTATVLTRLGEFPAEYISPALREQIQQSLDWLEQARTKGSGWAGLGISEPDAFTTSWAILALRAHGRLVPRSALDLVLACRQPNGGFSAYAQGSPMDGPLNPSSPEITVTALRALSITDSAAEEFLLSRLRTSPQTIVAGRASRLYVSAEILDWESGLAPWPLLNLVSQFTVQFDLEKPYEQALLLRTLLRLRNSRAWLAASALRDMQLSDGSWPACGVPFPSPQASTTINPVAFCDTRVISSVTALSALAMSESQPGLYFGSDLPRRLRDSEKM